MSDRVCLLCGIPEDRALCAHQWIGPGEIDVDLLTTALFRSDALHWYERKDVRPVAARIAAAYSRLLFDQRTDDLA